MTGAAGDLVVDQHRHGHTFTVSGMTCGHCVSSVTEEVGAIPGVTGVDIDLPTGAVTVTSQAELDVEAMRAAVVEAGYQLAG